jgi:hypothetical protein
MKLGLEPKRGALGSALARDFVRGVVRAVGEQHARLHLLERSGQSDGMSLIQNLNYGIFFFPAKPYLEQPLHRLQVTRPTLSSHCTASR